MALLTNCGALTRAIRVEIAEVASAVARRLMPRVSVREAQRCAVKPRHLIVLRKASRLQVQNDREQRMFVRFPIDTPVLKDLRYHFQYAGDHALAIPLPKYVHTTRLAQSNDLLMEKYYLQTVQMFEFVSRLRVALHVFDELNCRVELDSQLERMRYHLDWLPFILDRLRPRIVSDYEYYNNVKKNKHNAEERKEAREKFRAINRELRPSAKYWWPIPQELAKLVPIAAQAMSSARLLIANDYVKPSVNVDLYTEVFWTERSGILPYPPGLSNAFGFRYWNSASADT